MPQPECSIGLPRCVIASTETATAATRIIAPSMTPETCSIFSWPNGWPGSAGRSAARTETSAITDAVRSANECAASDSTADDPVRTAAPSFSTAAPKFAATDSHAAERLRREVSAAIGILSPGYGTLRRKRGLADPSATLARHG